MGAWSHGVYTCVLLCGTFKKSEQVTERKSDSVLASDFELSVVVSVLDVFHHIGRLPVSIGVHGNVQKTNMWAIHT